MFDAVDQVFRARSPTDPDSRTEPISVKKLGRGDAAWDTTKEVLGWQIDTIAGTISLPVRRQERLREILGALPRTRSRVAVSTWQKTLGELRSMAIALPGARGLFSLLQHALQPHQHRIRLNQSHHDVLDDFRWLADHLGSRPTAITETFPGAVHVIGACDACARGMGGVLFSSHASASPVVWRTRFPAKVQREVVSTSNSRGTITNSDLELAATIGQHEVATSLRLPRHGCIFTATDNTPALAWQCKGSTTTKGPAAYLLRVQALHQRHHAYTTQHAHIPGPANAMADDASRRWDLDDAAFLTHFSFMYPQATPWTMHHLPPGMHSSLVSALRTMRPDPGSYLPHGTLPIGPGKSGSTSAPSCTSTPFCRPSTTPLLSSKCTPTRSATEPPRAAANPSDLRQLIPPSVTWGRRVPFWGPRTLA